MTLKPITWAAAVQVLANKRTYQQQELLFQPIDAISDNLGIARQFIANEIDPYNISIEPWIARRTWKGNETIDQITEEWERWQINH